MKKVIKKKKKYSECVEKVSRDGNTLTIKYRDGKAYDYSDRTDKVDRMFSTVENKLTKLKEGQSRKSNSLGRYVRQLNKRYP